MKTILIGVIGVVAGSIATELLHWPRRAWTSLRKWATPDHQPLYKGWSLMSAPSSDQRVRVLAAVAPDRSRKATSISPDSAIAFVRERFRDDFPDQPSFSTGNEGIYFERDGGSLRNGYVWINPSGRVDYDAYIQGSFSSENSYEVELIDLLKPLMKLVNAISTTEYVRVFPVRRLGWPRKFDWYITVSNGVVRDDGATIITCNLKFPGAVPSRANGTNQASVPLGGYGGARLRSWNPSRGVDSVLRAFLLDFLDANGYYNCHDAIEDTIRATRQVLLSG